MSSELVCGQRWLRNQLMGNGTLQELVGDKAYEFPAPQDAIPPYILFDYRGGHDQSQQLLRGTVRTATDLLFGVVAVGADETVTTLDLMPVAEAIDEALEGQTGLIDDMQIYGCRREQPLMGAEIQSGATHRFLGGLYRVSVRPIQG
jgi:hypothetical protein